MGVDSVGIGISGLLAFQKSMATASHNITNADTEGFSRQRVSLSVNDALFTGDGFLGTGTGVSQITRIWDKFAQTNLNEVSSSSSKFNLMETLSDELDSIFSNEKSGLSPKIQDLFVSLQSVAESPSSSSAKKQFVTAADSLANRFNSLGSLVEGVEAESYGRQKNIVREINSYTNAISDLNKKIVNASVSSNRQPNDLYDQRDLLLLKLSEKIDVSTLDNKNGSINIFISNGQPLITVSGSREMILSPSEFDNSKMEVHLKSGQNTLKVSDQIKGGELGGVISFMTNEIPNIKRSIGRLAAWVSTTINNQHRTGIDENGNFGGDVFNIADSISKSSANNTGDARLAITFNKAVKNDLQSDVYRVTKTASSWIIVNENTQTNKTVTTDDFDFEGMNISLDSGTANAGDMFLISPTEDSLMTIRSQITSPALVATAYPIQSSSKLDYDVEVSSGELDYEIINNSLPTIPTELRNNYNIVLDQASGVFNIALASDPLNILATSSYDPTKSEQKISYGAWSFNISGNVPDGAEFYMKTAEGSDVSGDNRSTLDMASLQFENLFLNGTETIHGVYEDIVASVGSLAHNNSINAEAQSALLAQAEQRRAEVSGVNLDEEAANLIKLQQAYQAAAKVIQVADKMFQILINTV
jgi:flagellar hook-associated protein 1 FlgK